MIALHVAKDAQGAGQGAGAALPGKLRHARDDADGALTAVTFVGATVPLQARLDQTRDQPLTPVDFHDHKRVSTPEECAKTSDVHVTGDGAWVSMG